MFYGAGEIRTAHEQRHLMEPHERRSKGGRGEDKHRASRGSTTALVYSEGKSKKPNRKDHD